MYIFSYLRTVYLNHKHVNCNLIDIRQLIQMSENEQSKQILESMGQEVQFIESNRRQRNKRFQQCMGDFRGFLNQQTQLLELKEAENTTNKQLISHAFQNTYQRVLTSSDISLRKIKQTFNQKKIFWENVIKMNADISDIQLKKEFYLQKRNAEEGYQEAIDRQKDKHKAYKSLVNNNEKKQQLRDYQQTNKAFEEKVVQGTNTLMQWRNLINNTDKYASYSYEPAGRTVVDQFVHRNKNTNETFIKPIGNDYRHQEAENSTLFLNNFQLKK